MSKSDAFVFKSAPSPDSYYKYELENVLVTSYSINGSAGAREDAAFDLTAEGTGPQPIGLLLPAVQSAREAARDEVPIEEVTLSYTEIEWTY